MTPTPPPRSPRTVDPAVPTRSGPGPSTGGSDDARPSTGEGRPESVRRRHVLATAGTLVGVGLAGCLGGTGGTGTDVSPVSLAGDLQCDVCGMVISKHPGPNGQIFYRDESPAGHDNPARFDSLKQCLFPYLLEHDAMGWEERAIFATDYSAVDYDLQTEGEATYISSHTEPASFAPARDLHYVVGSEVRGAMGPDFVPFSSSDDADAFAEEHDGDVAAFDEIDEGLIGR